MAIEEATRTIEVTEELQDVAEDIEPWDQRMSLMEVRMTRTKFTLLLVVSRESRTRRRMIWSPMMTTSQHSVNNEHSQF